MKINKTLIGFSALFVTLLISGQSALVHAEDASTAVTIKITEPELYIESVDSPSFGKYATSDKPQEITSNSDLVIKVVDKREASGGWQLKYSLSMFEQEEKQTVQDGVTATISKGILMGDETETPKNVTEVYEIKQDTGDNKLVSLKESNATNYEYRVAGKGIQLGLPKNIETGKYSAIQTITLEELPTTID